MGRSTKSFTLALMIALAQWNAGPALAQDSSAKIHLLGTGAPIPRVDRFGPSTLVEVGGMRLLFDAGRGVSQRLWQLKLSLGSIDGVFLTHLHSDHLVGLPDLWLTGWLQPEYGRRKTPLRLFGPKGTSVLAKSLREGFAADVAYRSGKEGLPLEGIDFEVTEVAAEPVLFERNGVKVTAFDVDHGVVQPAYGYRIEFADKKIVISGDTRFSDNLLRHARGADVLIHEVVAAPAALRNSPFVQRQFGYHTSPEDLARLFNAAKPGMAVLTHFVLLGNMAHPAPTAEDVVKEIRSHGYVGPLTAGADLMRIEIGPSIQVMAPAPSK
jgi:ribonuclease Z